MRVNQVGGYFSSGSSILSMVRMGGGGSGRWQGSKFDEEEATFSFLFLIHFLFFFLTFNSLLNYFGGDGG